MEITLLEQFEESEFISHASSPASEAGGLTAGLIP